MALALMIRSAYLLRKRYFLPKVDLAEILKESLWHGNSDAIEIVVKKWYF